MVEKNVVVLGAGYWGINHVRNFFELGVLRGVCDSSPELLKTATQKYPVAEAYSTPEKVFLDPLVRSVVIATPAVTHYDLVKQALLNHKDVLVEKPLALKLSQAKELHELATKQGQILMVGHLLRYHPALVKLKELIAGQTLGAINYVYSNRLNLGKIRTEENILWSFAPHDVSVLLWLLDSMPIQVNVVGGNYLQPNITDTTISTLLFDNGVRSHIFVSWLHPFKEQRLVVVGSNMMAVFDDQADKEKKLMLYEKSVEMIQGQYVVTKSPGVPVSYDHTVEPLKEECQHFLTCVETRSLPLTDSQEGIRVLKVLHSCQRSLQMNGQPVQVLEYDL